MKTITGYTPFSDFGLFGLRVVLGVIFIAHGTMKWHMWDMQPTDQMPESMITIMKILSITEPLGGLALIFGFLTLFATIGLSISMFGALYLKIAIMHAPFMGMKGPGWEFDLIIIAGLLCIMFNTAGRYSMDWPIFSKGKKDIMSN